MSKNINEIIPKWRFPEFYAMNGWNEKRIGQLLKIGNGRDYKHLSKGNIPVYGSGGYMLTVNDYLHDGDSVCIGRKGTINNPFFIRGKFWAVDTLFYTHSYKDCIPSFIYNIFQKIDWLKYSEASGVPSLSKTTIEKINIFVPQQEEQQKIADCLSSIDDLISAEEKKLLLLNDYKKGWMQKLFPAEGKTVPEWRFPEFMNSGDWEENSLKKVLIKNSMKNKNQKYSLIESISNKFGFVRQDKYFENRRVASKNTSNYYVIKKGYFAYNPSRIDVGSLAYKYDDRTSIISPLYVSFKANNDVIDDIFLWMFFNSISFTKQIIFEGGVRNTLNYENLIQIKIFLPNLPEQQKIAGFLSGIDDLINKQTDKIKILKQHKKALMQGLFPIVEEVL